MARWIDLSGHGLSLTVLRAPDDDYLMMSGRVDKFERTLSALGFGFASDNPNLEGRAFKRMLILGNGDIDEGDLPDPTSYERYFSDLKSIPFVAARDVLIARNEPNWKVGRLREVHPRAPKPRDPETVAMDRAVGHALISYAGKGRHQVEKTSDEDERRRVLLLDARVRLEKSVKLIDMALNASLGVDAHNAQLAPFQVELALKSLTEACLPNVPRIDPEPGEVDEAPSFGR